MDSAGSEMWLQVWEPMMMPARCISSTISQVSDSGMLWNPLPTLASSAIITRRTLAIERSGSSADTVICGELVASRLRSRWLAGRFSPRSEEHTSELQSRLHLVCRLLLEKKKTINTETQTVPLHDHDI